MLAHISVGLTGADDMAFALTSWARPDITVVGTKIGFSPVIMSVYLP